MVFKKSTGKGEIVCEFSEFAITGNPSVARRKKKPRKGAKEKHTEEVLKQIPSLLGRDILFGKKSLLKVDWDKKEGSLKFSKE